MIQLTKINGGIIYVNPHQIEYIENRPDTTLVLLSGRFLIVKESYEVIYEKIVAYRREIGAFKNEE